jgi:hypothetical protein
MKAMFDQPFFSIGQDGVFQSQLLDRSIGHIDSPTKRFLERNNGFFWQVMAIDLAHAGGAIPYLMQRLLLGYQVGYEYLDPKATLSLPDAFKKVRSFNSLMKHLYCDTTEGVFPTTLANLQAVIGKPQNFIRQRLSLRA